MLELARQPAGVTAARGLPTMTDQDRFYYPYGAHANVWRLLLKVAALDINNLVLLDSISSRWDTVGADHCPREAVKQ